MREETRSLPQPSQLVVLDVFFFPCFEEEEAEEAQSPDGMAIKNWSVEQLARSPAKLLGNFPMVCCVFLKVDDSFSRAPEKMNRSGCARQYLVVALRKKLLKGAIICKDYHPFGAGRYHSQSTTSALPLAGFSSLSQH